MSYNDADTRNGGSASFLIGFIAGSVLGAGLALLFAPRTGPEMRRELADRAQRLRERAADGYDTASERVADFAERGKAAYRNAADKASAVPGTGTGAGAGDTSAATGGPTPTRSEPLG